MVTVAKVSLDSLARPPLLTTLTVAAAEHALVLVCQPAAVADGLMAGLRKALPQYEIVALTLASMSPAERELIARTLAKRMIPLVVTEWDWMVVRLTSWLDSEITLTSYGEARAA